MFRFWDWDWEWAFVGIVAGGLYILGIILAVCGVPGIVAPVIGAIVGGLAGSFEWFER